jgi:hypothetical protein
MTVCDTSIAAERSPAPIYEGSEHRMEGRGALEPTLLENTAGEGPNLRCLVGYRLGRGLLPQTW